MSDGGACSTHIIGNDDGGNPLTQRAPFAEELRCAKTLLVPDQRFCSEIDAGAPPPLSDFNGLVNSRYGAYCAMLGPVGNWVQRAGAPADAGVTDGGDAGEIPQRPAWMCFARADCEGFRDTTDAGTDTGVPETGPSDAGQTRCIDPTSFDPGNDPSGNEYANTASSTSSTARVENKNNPSDGFTATVDARASVDFSQSNRVNITQLRVTQRGSDTFGGETVSEVLIQNEDVWTGTWNSSTSRFEFETTSGKLQVRSTIGGVIRWRRLSQFRASVVSWAKNLGSQVEIAVEFEDTENDIVLKLSLKLDVVADRPTASITSTTSLTPECTGPSGATVSATGSASSGVSGVSASSAWLWSPTDELSAVAHDVSSFTVQVPLETSTHPGHVLRFISQRGVFVARDSRTLRAVDTPPTINSTQLSLPCGWGSSTYEPNPQDPSLCGLVVGSFSDTCSTTSIETLAIRMYEFPSGTLLSSTTYGNGQNVCLEALAGYLDSNISNVDYEIDYRVKDSWNNWSGGRRWRGWVYFDTPSSSCSAVPKVVTLSDVDL